MDPIDDFQRILDCSEPVDGVKGLPVPDRDYSCDNQEDRSPAKNQVTTLEVHSSVWKKRSRALRARGLSAISVADAVIDRRGLDCPNGSLPQTQRGSPLGQVQPSLHSLKACLTSRSSPE